MLVHDLDFGGKWFDKQVGTSWLYSLMKWVLTLGPIPRHIAFVMDGNRRYARTHLCSTTLDGHVKGFDRLTHILEWCSSLGVKEVTVFAFSIENFKRSKDEIDGLMQLFEAKLQQLLEEKNRLIEKDIAIRFFGDLSYLPSKLQKLAAEIELLTNYNEREIINVCVAYTSQDEIKRAFQFVREGVKQGLIHESDISERLISSCLDSRRSIDPDILIRTSGEKRFSDFLLWQCSKCYIHFDDVLWPEFTFWNLFKAILGYQYNFKKVQDLSETCAEYRSDVDSDKISSFLDWVENNRLNKLRQMQSQEFIS